MANINYKSDFDFILRLKDCQNQDSTVPFPEGNFDVRFWTSSKANAYTASCRDGVYTNCFRTDDGGMHFVFDNHRLGIGTLKWEPHFEHPNDIYPDNTQDIFRKATLDIELVDGDGDCPTTAEAEAIAPIIKGEKGDKGDRGERGPEGPQGPQGERGAAFTYEDFTPEQIEELQRPATAAAESISVLEANISAEEHQRTLKETSRARAEYERQHSELKRVANETARQTTEATRQGNELERIEAESDRESAETARAEEFATWETEIDSKADRSELSNVLADEPLTSENFPDINTYTREELKKDLFVDMWNTRLSLYPDSETHDIDGYDESTGEFILNGLRLSYEDALMIYTWSAGIVGYAQKLYKVKPIPAKTLFWPFTSDSPTDADLRALFQNQHQLEVLQIQTQNGASLYASRIAGMFSRCSAFRELRGKLIVQYAVSESDYMDAFFGCYALEEIRISKIKFSIEFGFSPNLSLASLQYMVANAANKNAITITVHSNVYGKLTDESDTEWHQVLLDAAAKNINFATA